jgi:uncharacterized protein
MKTTISGSLQDGKNRARWLLLAILASAAIVVDFTILIRDEYASYSAYRVINAVVVLALFMCITPSPRGDLGIRLLPVQGFPYWARISAYLFAIVIAVGLAGVAAIAYGLTLREVTPALPPDRFAQSLVHACVQAPLFEETLYRLILCAPLAAVSPALAITISGIVFAALHFVYGNPGADNFIAGYLLAWAYMKSGTIAVPIVLHAVGNAIAMGFQVAAWYVLYG